ncbi:hypothetical protein [Larkinella rosea]|uniref:Uncharacterized protein n=1 Tax=Larkinella rosea TaxID=2025312 RepID=A0A3P1C075_9BACT|nr:hypothetical protein [Larkinella rosea]RRB06526.1 hypothetical protein EHT25_01615 [Larkinella rosea]
MWYFTLRQDDLSSNQYRFLQQKATLTEVELFNEPYSNLRLFGVASEQYRAFVDALDLEGLHYQVMSERPTRKQLLESMR